MDYKIGYGVSVPHAGRDKAGTDSGFRSSGLR
jgi:hypothetical protein